MKNTLKGKVRWDTLVAIATLVLVTGGFAYYLIAPKEAEQNIRSIPFFQFDVGLESPPSSLPESPPLTAQTIYAPQPSRNAEFLGRIAGAQFSDAQMNIIAKNTGYFVLDKNEANFNLAQQFAEAKAIRAKAATLGNPIKIFAYYNVTYFYTQAFSQPGWGSYLDGFQDAWYEEDAFGQPIAFTVGSSTEIKGRVINPADVDYRSWTVHVLASWLSAGNYDGVLFDNAHPRVGDDKDNRIGNVTWNEKLCNTVNDKKATEPDCNRVTAWNSGLTALMHEIHTAFVAVGKSMMYNGVSPGPSHGPDRNAGFLSLTGAATDEGFCYAAGDTPEDKLFRRFPILDDLAFMRAQAAQGHTLLMITNTHNDPRKLALGSYCLGAFLLGWQPGYDYYVYHTYYIDDFSSGYPEIAEQNLNLGLPTAQYVAHGDLLTRAFENGFIAVNNGTGSLMLTLPDDLTEFKNGVRVASYAKGAMLPIAPDTGRFFLKSSLLTKQ